MMASGSGTRSAVPIMVETKLMWPLPSFPGMISLRDGFHFSGSCVRWQREELTGTGLILAVVLAARAQHLRFQRRNAGLIDQDPVHEDRRQQRRPSEGIEKRIINRQRDHGIGQPT